MLTYKGTLHLDIPRHHKGEKHNNSMINYPSVHGIMYEKTYLKKEKK